MSWKRDSANERRDMEKVKPWIIGKLRLDNLEEANLQQQREEDIDLIGTRESRTIPIEVKIRHEIYGDFLLETISNTTTKSKGWIYKSQAELLIYIIMKKGHLTGSILIMGGLQRWWKTEGIYRGYPEKLGKTDELYKTRNVAIPWKDIPPDILIYHNSHNAVNDYFNYHKSGMPNWKEE